MYTCIAYSTEIRKFCSKNLIHKGVNFEAQNALKLRVPLISKKIRGLYPRTPVKRGTGGERGRGGEEEGKGGAVYNANSHSWLRHSAHWLPT